jgi:hypothetical protein
MRLASWLLLAVLAQTASGAAPTPSLEADQLLLQVVVDKQPLEEVISGYQRGDDVLLPLGELARLLTLAITTQPEQGTASGYVIQEERAFNLDLPRKTLMVEGRRAAADLAQIESRADDLYVPSKLLARWLPVDLQIDLATLAVIVRPRERLPLQYRLEREANARRLAGGRSTVPESRYPAYNIPYRMMDWPFVDQTLGVDYRGRGPDSSVAARYAVHATADMLRMQGAFYGNTDSRTGDTQVRLTLGRNDPDGGLLGPLHARTAMFGSISAPAEANIAHTSVRGEGFEVSNRPLSQPTSFGQHSLIGSLPQDWDVELYLNGALIGYQTSGPDGQYHFADQPLMFGPNEFRLVFHGPLGQVRVEKEVFLLDQSSLAPGEFYYNVDAQHDDQGHVRGAARFDWGMGHKLVLTGGLFRAPTNGDDEHFARLGLQSYGRAMLITADVIKSRDGLLEQMDLRTRLGNWALSLNHAELQDFSSEVFSSGGDPVRGSSRLRINGAFTWPGSSLRLPATLEIKQERRESGATNNDIAARLSANLRGWLTTGQLHVSSFAGNDASDATVQVSRSVAGISLRSQLNYLLSPDRRLSAIALTADKRLGRGYLGSAGIARDFGSSDTQFTAGVSKSVGHFGLSVQTGYSRVTGATAGVQLFMAMGSDRRGAGWLFDAQPMANTGGVSARVFLDDNMNGRLDEDEQGIADAGFAVNGGKAAARTDARGITYLARLPSMTYTDVAVLPETLEDPHWVPQVQGVRLVPRPGAVAMLDIPVWQTSEVEGTVYLQEGGRRRAIGGVIVEIVDAAGRVLGTSTCGADGYYVVAGVPPGAYEVRASVQQLQRLRAEPVARRAIQVERDGWLVSGADLELRASAEAAP